MERKKILVKNMVCHRCVLAVEHALEKSGIAYEKVSLGEIELKKTLSERQKKILDLELRSVGFEIIDDRISALMEKIKKSIHDYLRDNNDLQKKKKLSTYISGRVNYEYSYISNLFSSVEGITIEHYFILQRIEKVKELLVYGQLSLNEIADQLGFSSINHLSAQFKKSTGLTPTHFKKLGAEKRKTLDKVV